MIYVLCAVGLFVTILWPLIKFIAGFFIKDTKDDHIQPVSNKSINMLIDFANLMTKHIQNNLEINSPLIFFEQVYLLYFFRDMYAVSKKLPESSRHAMLNDLILTLEYNHKFDCLENKDIFKDVFSKRYENYMNILLHDNYDFSDNFFNDVFEYQTAQVMSIKNKNQFTNFNPELTCLENTPEELRIKSIVSDNKSLIDAFMAQQ